MKKRLSAVVAAAVAATALVGANSASAATVFGSGCTANQITDGAIWVSTGHAPANTLPVTAPISGVITEWTVNTNIAVESEGKLVGEFPRVLQQRLLVLRAEGELFKVIGEAAGGPLNLKGSNTYKARVPVQAGDYLGIAGNPFTGWCETKEPGDTYAAATGGTPVGSVFRVERSSGLQVPITARVEPDADGDGYGDETQDQCPQSAAYQTACPVVTVSSLSLTHPKAVTVYISSSLSAPIGVTATVKLGKGKTATLTAPGQTVAPGTLGRFNLALNKPVLKTLEALTTQKALTMTVSASATNVTGSPSTATSMVKLRGQRKPTQAKKAHQPAKKKPKKHKHH
ncbi:MAG: hypothetical protein JST53_16555 [Actinobacteria bacterium]|nr:hypothetical protein [Actinomycetota bacterium]